MANPLGELKRVRFIYHHPSGVIISSYGLWREGEIAEILDMHQKAGRQVEVEVSGMEVVPRTLGQLDFAVWLGTDADFFDEFTEVDG